MINCMYQVDYITGNPDVWLDIISGCVWKRLAFESNSEWRIAIPWAHHVNPSSHISDNAAPASWKALLYILQDPA